MNSSQSVTETQVEFISLWVRTMKIKLSFRGSVIYARLCKFSKPIHAFKLAASLNGMVYKRTIVKYLHELEKAGLASHSERGWVAVRPNENPTAFVWSKETPYYYTILLPERNPFPKRANALELLAIYFKLRRIESCQGEAYHTTMAADLGITRKTVAKGIMTLEKLGLYVEGKTQPQTWKNAIWEREAAAQDIKDASQNANEDANEDSTQDATQDANEKRLISTVHEAECFRLIADLKLRIDMAVIRREIDRAFHTHDSNVTKGDTHADGSGMVLAYLKKLQPASGTCADAIEKSVAMATAKETAIAAEERHGKAKNAARICVCLADRVNRSTEITQLLRDASVEVLEELASLGRKDLTLAELVARLSPVFTTA